MPHIDLYAVHGLDRRQPPEELAAVLTAQLNAVDSRDTLTRNRLETARAILGDPARRARYDAALADPAAPILDENALAAIAGRTAPGVRPTNQPTFAEIKVKILAGVASGLAVALVVAIVAVACSSPDEGTSTPSAASSSSASTSSEHQRSTSSTSSPAQGIPFEPYPAEQEVHLGGTVVVDAHFEYHLTRLSRVNDPTPECPGAYYSLETTVKSIDNGHGSARPLKVVTGDTAGNLNNQPVVDASPLQCNADAVASFSGGSSAPVTTYIRIKGLDDPVVLYIRSDTGGRPNSPRFITIPENLR
ncbi:hypothetical protein [Gordonia amicalis]|uniref:hypothetical protein n=1 Tax=Gordonia amicalis TaxID=89053 RepID=UPI0024BB42B3|nr:hypothetical protein [Gordonia amicalis]MDJ0454096.1 hypothetical protein [Gordonia amicalis]MDV7077240.1 hypothetical protein [Gordonia amicalis]